MSIQIYNAEILAWSVQEAERVKSGESAPYHAVLCDPPYLIGFMSKDWDGACSPIHAQKTFQQWGEALKPLLHPGALVFMFAGTRMWHRLAAGMEDAGFHLWDTLMWLHGQGFPKAQDISKLIDKSRSAEREVVGSVKKLQSFGHSGNNCYGGDVDRGGLMKLTSPASEISAPWAGHKTPQLKPAWEPVLCFRAPADGERYAHLALEYGSGCLNVDAGRIETFADSFEDEREVKTNVVFGKYGVADYDGSKGRYPANLALDEMTAPILGEASRFFYQSKASRSEREAGLEDLPMLPGGSNAKGFTEDVAKGLDRNKPVHNHHPTVKPINLNKWLAGLLLPPNSVSRRRLLVPFSGVGSEMIGASLAGWDDITGVEMNPEYTSIARERLKHWTTQAAPEVLSVVH
jgi:DNA modification methylase